MGCKGTDFGGKGKGKVGGAGLKGKGAGAGPPARQGKEVFKENKEKYVFKENVGSVERRGTGHLSAEKGA
eukprot:10882805-Karenia_brevis.AAC.1